MPGRGRYWKSGGLVDSTVTSADIKNSEIVNADLSSSAEIAVTKLASGSANQVVKTNSGGTALEHGKITNSNLTSGSYTNITEIGSLAADLIVGEHDIVTDTTTGTKIGTATNQKLGFFNAQPVVQQSALTANDISDVDGTYGAEEQAVIINIRARVLEIEEKLQALGLLAGLT